jgi:hypothetical protein
MPTDPSVTATMVDQRSGRKSHVIVWSPTGTSTPRSTPFTRIAGLGVSSTKTVHPGAQVSMGTASWAQSDCVRIAVRSGRSFVTVPVGGAVDCPVYLGIAISGSWT